MASKRVSKLSLGPSSKRVTRNRNSESIALLIQMALKRTPAVLDRETTYLDRELIDACIQENLRGWTACFADGAVWDEEHQGFKLGYPAAADWPSKDEEGGVEEYLEKGGCSNPKDLMGGHCEPIALILCNMMKEILISESNPSALGIPTLAHERTLQSLREMGTGEAAAEVFGGPFINGFRNDDGLPSWKPGDVWGELFTDLEYHDLVLGTEAVKCHIKRTAKAALEGEGIVQMPLYLLNYILTVEDKTKEIANMDRDEGEAMYDIHVVGLLFDGRNGDDKKVYVADPNGALIPGSNFEFLKIPIRKRTGKPTTKEGEYNKNRRQARNRAKAMAKDAGAITK